MSDSTIISPNTKTAIVLFNLGGPDSLSAVQPFLFNLFNDPAIIKLPQPFRYMLAKLISKKRAQKKAIPIYEKMGGKSPILENTQAQADALRNALSSHGNVETFICMRYWHPMANEAVKQVKNYAPDNIILLSLYPQYSTTTTQSSLDDFAKHAKCAGLNVPMHTVCCYATHPDFIAAQAELIRPYYEKAANVAKPLLLLSAHGLPEKIIAAGDPYQKQVEATSEAVVKALNIKGLESLTCYQSRVGPLKWIGPDTEEVIKETAAAGRPIVLAPVAFVSEHSETLVELDIDYKNLCDVLGMPHYYRVPTVSVHPKFIACLKQLCLVVKANEALCETPQACVKTA